MFIIIKRNNLYSFELKYRGFNINYLLTFLLFLWVFSCKTRRTSRTIDEINKTTSEKPSLLEEGEDPNNYEETITLFPGSLNDFELTETSDDFECSPIAAAELTIPLLEKDNIPQALEQYRQSENELEFLRFYACLVPEEEKDFSLVKTKSTSFQNLVIFGQRQPGATRTLGKPPAPRGTLSNTRTFPTPTKPNPAPSGNNTFPKGLETQKKQLFLTEDTTLKIPDGTTIKIQAQVRGLFARLKVNEIKKKEKLTLQATQATSEFQKNNSRLNQKLKKTWEDGGTIDNLIIKLSKSFKNRSIIEVIDSLKELKKSALDVKAKHTTWQANFPEEKKLYTMTDLESISIHSKDYLYSTSTYNILYLKYLGKIKKLEENDLKSYKTLTKQMKTKAIVLDSDTQKILTKNSEVPKASEAHYSSQLAEPMQYSMRGSMPLKEIHESLQKLKNLNQKVDDVKLKDNSTDPLKTIKDYQTKVDERLGAWEDSNAIIQQLTKHKKSHNLKEKNEILEQLKQRSKLMELGGDSGFTANDQEKIIKHLIVEKKRFTEQAKNSFTPSSKTKYQDEATKIQTLITRVNEMKVVEPKEASLKTLSPQ